MSDPGPRRTFNFEEESDSTSPKLILLDSPPDSRQQQDIRIINIIPATPTEEHTTEEDSQPMTTMPSVTMPTDTHSPQFLSDTEASTSIKSDSDSGKAGVAYRSVSSPTKSDDTASKSSSDLPLDPITNSASDIVKKQSPFEKMARKMKFPYLKVPSRTMMKSSTSKEPTSIKSAPVVLEGTSGTTPMPVTSPRPQHSDNEKLRRQVTGAFPALSEATTKAFFIAEAITTLKKGPATTVTPPKEKISSEHEVPIDASSTGVVIDEEKRLSLQASSLGISEGKILDSAAAKLKHTEGAVKLTVCTPNLKDKKEDAPLAEETGSATTSVPAGSAASRSASGNQTPDPGLAAAGSSRPHSPRPAPSPVRTEPPADPATAPIQPNQDTIIEITTESQSLGLFLLGGSDTSINGPAAVVLDVIQDRPVGRDGRLQRGDQIRAACGIQLTEAMTEDRLNMTIKQWAPKLKFTVFRPDPIQYEDIEVDVNRKQGPLGFSFAAFSNDRGIYITQILPGSPAEQDGRLRRGDHILTVDGKDVSSAEFTAASVALKLIGPKVSIKIRRLKIVR